MEPIEILVYDAKVKVGKGTKTRDVYMVCDSRFGATEPKQIESLEGVIGYCLKSQPDTLFLEVDNEEYKIIRQGLYQYE